MDYLGEIVGNLGFPAAVAMFLLIRLEEKLATLGECIKRLTVAVERMEATVRTQMVRRSD